MNGFRSLGTGVLLAVVMTACSDSVAPVTMTDPRATSAALGALDSALAAPVVASFGVLGSYINPSAAVVRAALTGAPPDVQAAQHVTALRGLAASIASPQGPVVPDTLYGAVFTWDSASAQYTRTQTTGGPSNGVRFVLYAVNPITGAIVYPLVPVGTADLLDESTATTAKLHVVVQDTAATPTTYLDYTATLESAVVVLHATITGFVTNGASGAANKTLTFSVTAQVTFTTVTAQAILTLNNPAISVGLDVTVSNLQGTETVSVNYTLTRPGETVRLQGYLTKTNGVLDTVSAEIRVNGRVFATLEGNAQGLTFYDHDGNVIADAGAQHDVLQALDHLRKAVENTLDFIESLFNPIVNLFSS